jgi:hypothetical protein
MKKDEMREVCGDTGDVYKILIGTHEGKRLVERIRCRWNEVMTLKETGHRVCAVGHDSGQPL